ncbi:MAG TPA: hypothetical protein VJ729_14955 [Nitrososphaeraceae archaeon]|nr:hypothetical protein [Nitrososphaeraceae archaeon]
MKQLVLVKITAFAYSGHCPSKELRIYRDIKLMVYAAKKITMAIFHLGGGV